MYTDLVAHTYDEEAAITELHSPVVIDAGSRFTDRGNNQHENACGWLAIHAALHFASFCKRLPTDIVRQLNNTELTPDRLKIMSGCDSLTSRIIDGNIDAICSKLKLKIIVYERGVQCVFGQNNRFIIHLWLSQFHYSVLINQNSKNTKANKSELRATKFVSEFEDFGYELKMLKPISDEMDSYQAALQIHQELNGTSVASDAEYAMLLQMYSNRQSSQLPGETLLQSYQRIFG